MRAVATVRPRRKELDKLDKSEPIWLYAPMRQGYVSADWAGFVREGVARRSRPDRDGTARDMVLFSLTVDRSPRPPITFTAPE